MIETTKYFLIGAIIGIGTASLIHFWIRFFMLQLPKKDLKSSAELVEFNTKYYPWGFIFCFSIFIAFLADWRKLSPYFLNDLLLVSSLTVITHIDLKTMYIEGRTIAFAIIMRLVWIIYFEPQEMFNYLSGLFFGAGLLYLVSFFYQTLRNTQGLGDGDAAVLGLIGLWLGWKSMWTVLLIAAISGIIISVFNLFLKKKKHQNISSILKTKIAFAPFLCFGGLLLYFLKEADYYNFREFY